MFVDGGIGGQRWGSNMVGLRKRIGVACLSENIYAVAITCRAKKER